MSIKEEPEFGPFIDGNKISVVDYHQHLSRYLFGASFVKDKLCLDIACGTGYGSAYLARKGASKVVTGDLSADAISYARTNATSAPENTLAFQLFNATALPFADNSFGVVTAFEIIEHLDDYERLLPEIHRVLAKGGTLILSTPNRLAGPFFYGTSWHHHTHEFTPSELVELVQKYFDDTQIFGQFFMDKKGILLKRIRQTVGRILVSMQMKSLQGWLGRLLFKDNRLLMTYRTEDFNSFTTTSEQGEILPITGGLSPFTLVIVATRS